MTTKTITITEDAYERLAALKREGESFTDLITRLTEQKDPISFVGSCPGLGEYVTETKSDLDADLRDQQDELFG